MCLFSTAKVPRALLFADLFCRGLSDLDGWAEPIIKNLPRFEKLAHEDVLQRAGLRCPVKTTSK